MNRELPPAILFDLDDTILSFGTLADDAWKRVVGHYVQNLPGVKSETLLSAVLERRDWYWSDPERHRRGRLGYEDAYGEIVRQAFGQLGLAESELASQIAESYGEVRGSEIKPIAVVKLANAHGNFAILTASRTAVGKS